MSKLCRRWMTASAEYVGRGHILKDIPCQDATATYRNRDITIIALADGAGSAAHSAIGAQICVESIVTYFKNPKLRNFNTASLKERLLKQILQNLTRIANKKNHSINKIKQSIVI